MINLNYNGKSFNQRNDGFVNLGQLCATHGKAFKDWSRLQGSVAYLEALAESLSGSDGQKIPASKIIISDVDASGGKAGTWGHPLVAIEVARWISPAFGVWCNQHIKVLLENGSTSRENNAPPPRQLPPQRDAIEYIEAYQKLEKFPEGILKKLLTDKLVDDIGLDRNNALPPAKKDYTIVKVRRGCWAIPIKK